MRRFLTAETLFFVATWFACAAVFRSRGFHDPGSLWHTRIGERVLRDGFFRTDPLTFTFAGQDWIPQFWLGEIGLALAHAVGGLDTILLACSLLMAGTFTFVFRRLRAGGMGWPLALAVAGFALVAAGFHFYFRPHLVTIVLLALVVAALVSFDRARIPLRRLFWLVPLHAAWANAHGGMLGGVATVGIATFGWIVLRLANRESPLMNHRAIGAAIVLAILCALAALLNPYGLDLPRSWFRIVGEANLGRYITEHSPLNPAREGDRAVLAFAALALAIALTVPIREWRATTLIPLAWFAMTLKGIRHGPLFVVSAAIVLADLWPRSRLHAALARSGDSLTRDPSLPLDPPTHRAALVPAALVAIAMALQAGRVPFPLIGHGWAKLDAPHTMPVDLVEPLRDYANAVPVGTPLYNDLNFGGFVVYFAPTLKTFADDRFELCGVEWLDDYVNTIENHPERIEDWQRRYGFTRALVARGGRLDAYLARAPRWTIVAVGSSAVFHRLRSEN